MGRGPDFRSSPRITTTTTSLFGAGAAQSRREKKSRGRYTRITGGPPSVAIGRPRLLAPAPRLSKYYNRSPEKIALAGPRARMIYGRGLRLEGRARARELLLFYFEPAAARMSPVSFLLKSDGKDSREIAKVSMRRQRVNKYISYDMTGWKNLEFLEHTGVYGNIQFFSSKLCFLRNSQERAVTYTFCQHFC